MRQLAHVRVVPQQAAGRAHIVTNDQIVAVCDDGTEVDFSSAVQGWELVSTAGDPRRLHLHIISSVVDMVAVDAALEGEEAAP